MSSEMGDYKRLGSFGYTSLRENRLVGHRVTRFKRLIRSAEGDTRLSFMQITPLLGFMAGTLTTLSFVPQAHKAWQTKRCDDLSWGMLLAFAAGVVLWVIYGMMLRAAPVIVANAVTLALLLAIIVMKARYRTF